MIEKIVINYIFVNMDGELVRRKSKAHTDEALAVCHQIVSVKVYFGNMIRRVYRNDLMISGNTLIK